MSPCKHMFPSILFQALLMKEYSLSIILLSRSLIEAKQNSSQAECSKGTGDESIETGAKKVVFAIVNIMAHAHDFPNALAKCILPAVDRYVNL